VCSTDAAKIPGNSCAFVGGNSLLAGNLAGNSQNPAEFAPFRARARLDRVTYQRVRHEFGNYLLDTAKIGSRIFSIK